MTHFICKGSECTSTSERPNVCMNASCSHKYKLLEECSCPHRSRHLVRGDAQHILGKQVHSIEGMNFGLAFGIVFGVGIFFLGIISIFGWGTQAVKALSGIYIGYDSTVIGAIAGGLWGLVGGFLGGVFIAWLYNQLSRIR